MEFKQITGKMPKKPHRVREKFNLCSPENTADVTEQKNFKNLRFKIK